MQNFKITIALINLAYNRKRKSEKRNKIKCFANIMKSLQNKY